MGYFKIDRKLFEHYLWQDKPFSKGQAWIDLIGLASFDDGRTMYQGRVINCTRGTVYRSLNYLSQRWGWSRKKTSAFIRALERDEMVTAKVTTHGTAITIENYGKFQDVGTAKGTTKEQQKNNRGTAEEQQKNKDKRSIRKYKEVKENNKTIKPSARPLSEMTDEELEAEGWGFD